VATSRAILSRWIGRANGPDQAFLSHFATKPLNFSEINPQYDLLLVFIKKPLNFSKINPQSRHFYDRPSATLGRPAFRMGRALRRVASNGPKTAHKSLFLLYSLIFSFKSEIFQSLYKITKKS
jgi:hypothetical protein